MINFAKSFARSEEGAVTVDFVVLAAVMVVIGLIVGAKLTSGAAELAQSQADHLEARPLGTDWDWR